MTLTAQSVRAFGFGVVIEQILCGANFMLIGPQENVSLNIIVKTEGTSPFHNNYCGFVS